MLEQNTTLINRRAAGTPSPPLLEAATAETQITITPLSTLNTTSPPTISTTLTTTTLTAVMPSPTHTLSKVNIGGVEVQVSKEFIIASILNITTLGKYIYESAVAGHAWIMEPATFAAASLIYAIPIIVLFALSQKYIGEAYRLGAVEVSSVERTMPSRYLLSILNSLSLNVLNVLSTPSNNKNSTRLSRLSHIEKPL